MPWLSIIMALIVFLTAKKKGATTQQAALAGAAAGLGTYYVTHETEWGVKNLGDLDGVTVPTDVATIAGTTTSTTGGTVCTIVPNPGTGLVSTVGSGASGALTTTGEVLKSWGPAGTLGVVAGTSAIDELTDSKWFVPVLVIGALLLLRK